MAIELLLATAVFAFVTSITPGPNNVILLASGANFGFRRTMPFALGINAGFMIMLAVVGMGLGQIIQADPRISLVLKIVSVAYVLWLAWKIASSNSVPRAEGDTTARPISFVQGALLQWVNPKAWAVALIATVTYTTPADYTLSLVLLILVFAVVNLPSICTWAISGAVLRRFLQDPVKRRTFNIVMALLLVATMVPILVTFFD